MNLTRLPDWERRLVAVTRQHIAMPGVWGVSDCLLTAADSIEAVTGHDLLAPWRGRYRTEKGAARLMRREGCHDVDDVFRAFFALPPVGRLSAQRGDVGTILQGGQLTAGFVTGEGFAAKGERGLIFHPVTAIVAAFRIGER
jgi:hypothetical protein